jgi:2-polyprenyl-6-methoxyphenol hydroxylase-like FAD-dependent oxidoreductase
MGLGESLAKVGAKVGPGSQYYRMDGTVVGSILTTDSSGWNGMYGMHRADLLAAFAGALPPTTVRTGYRCIAFEQNDHTARLIFDNGETAEADVVIAADGIHSTLQTYVVAPSPPEYSGSRAYRGLIAAEKLPDWRKEAHQVWMGEALHGVSGATMSRPRHSLPKRKPCSRACVAAHLLVRVRQAAVPRKTRTASARSAAEPSTLTTAITLIMDEARLHLATADGSGNVGIAAQVLAFIEPRATLSVPAAAFSVLALSVSRASFPVPLALSGASFSVSVIALAVPGLSRGCAH